MKRLAVAGNNSQLRYEIRDKGRFEELQPHAKRLPPDGFVQVGLQEVISALSSIGRERITGPPRK